MKKISLILLTLFLAGKIFSQTTGKISGTETESIKNIGSVPTELISKLGTITNPVTYKNCKEIKENNPGAADGIYTIDPDGSGAIEPFDCFCDMTTDGGGWTMVGYYRHPSTEHAPADLDNRDYSYFMKARTDQAYGKPEYIANPNSDGAWTDWRVLAGVTWAAQFAIILDQPSYSTWADVSPKVIFRVKSREIMPNYGTAQDLFTADNLYYKLNFATGYSDVGSSSLSDTYFWYPRDSGNEYLTSFHISNYLYNSGEPTNYHYGAYSGTGLVFGDNTWYHSARMFIR